MFRLRHRNLLSLTRFRRALWWAAGGAAVLVAPPLALTWAFSQPGPSVYSDGPAAPLPRPDPLRALTDVLKRGPSGGLPLAEAVLRTVDALSCTPEGRRWLVEHHAVEVLSKCVSSRGGGDASSSHHRLHSLLKAVVRDVSPASPTHTPPPPAVLLLLDALPAAGWALLATRGSAGEGALESAIQALLNEGVFGELRPPTSTSFDPPQCLWLPRSLRPARPLHSLARGTLWNELQGDVAARIRMAVWRGVGLIVEETHREQGVGYAIQEMAAWGAGRESDTSAHSHTSGVDVWKVRLAARAARRHALVARGDGGVPGPDFLPAVMASSAHALSTTVEGMCRSALSNDAHVHGVERQIAMPLLADVGRLLVLVPPHRGSEVQQQLVAGAAAGYALGCAAPSLSCVCALAAELGGPADASRTWLTDRVHLWVLHCGGGNGLFTTAPTTSDAHAAAALPSADAAASLCAILDLSLALYGATERRHALASAMRSLPLPVRDGHTLRRLPDVPSLACSMFVGELGAAAQTPLDPIVARAVKVDVLLATLRGPPDGQGGADVLTDEWSCDAAKVDAGTRTVVLPEFMATASDSIQRGATSALSGLSRGLRVVSPVATGAAAGIKALRDIAGIGYAAEGAGTERSAHPQVTVGEHARQPSTPVVVADPLLDAILAGECEGNVPVTPRVVRRNLLARYGQLLPSLRLPGSVLTVGVGGSSTAGPSVPVYTTLGWEEGGTTATGPPSGRQAEQPPFALQLPSLADVLIACAGMADDVGLQAFAVDRLRALLPHSPDAGLDAGGEAHLQLAQRWLAASLRTLVQHPPHEFDRDSAVRYKVSLSMEVSRWFLRELEGCGGVGGRPPAPSLSALPYYIRSIAADGVRAEASAGKLPSPLSELLLPRTIVSTAFHIHALKALAYGTGGAVPCSVSTRGDTAQQALNSQRAGRHATQVLLQTGIEVPLLTLAAHYASDHGGGTPRATSVLRQAMRLLANLHSNEDAADARVVTLAAPVVQVCLRSQDVKLRAHAAKAWANLGLDQSSAQRLYGDMLMPVFDAAPSDATPSGTSPSCTCIDVVLVHGLQGAALKTWRAEVDPTTWLEQHEEWRRPTWHGLLPDAGVSIVNGGQRKALWPLLWLSTDLHELRLPGQGTPPAAPHGPPSVRITAVAYDADMLSSTAIRPALPLPALAEHVSRQLVAAGVGGEGRPTLFLCHSMGGLLVKQLLARTEAGRRVLLPSTAGVVFYGVPHKGSHLASAWLRALGVTAEGGVGEGGVDAVALTDTTTANGTRWLPSIPLPAALGGRQEGQGAAASGGTSPSSRRSGLRGQLSLHVEDLGDVGSLAALDADFHSALTREMGRRQQPCPPLPILSLGEGGPTSLASALSMPRALPELAMRPLALTIVGPESANPGYGAFVLVPGSDHVTICKPRAPERDARYDAVLPFVSDALAALCEGSGGRGAGHARRSAQASSG